MRAFAYACVTALILLAGILGSFILLSPRNEPPGRNDTSEDDRRITAKTTHSGEMTGAPSEGGVAPSGLKRTSGPQRDGALSLQEGLSSVLFHLRDESGRPMTPATVTLLSQKGSRTSAAEEDGTVLFSAIVAGTYTYRIEGEGFAAVVSARELSVEPDEEKEVDVTIPEHGLSISGRVLDATGNPVAGITVGARRHSLPLDPPDVLLAEPEKLTAESGPEGEYEIAGLDVADYVMATEATERFAGVRRVVRAGVQSADLVLGSVHEIDVYGVVTSEEGSAVEGVDVALLGQVARRTRTDASGRYRLRLELSGEQSTGVLKASAKGYRETTVNLHRGEPGGEESRRMDLVLHPLGPRVTVVGQLLDTSSLRPVVGETVHLQSPSLKSRHHTVSEADGMFALKEVEVADDYRLWVYPRSGYQDYSRTPLAVSENGLELKVLLKPIGRGRMRGVMVDPEGSPVPRVTLWLRSMKALGNSLPVTGDHSGRFDVEDVPEGDILLETRATPRWTIRGIRIRPGEQEEVRLILDWGWLPLEGTVEDEAGNPIPSASVTLSWSGGDRGVTSSSLRKTATDAEGRFGFTELAPGAYALRASSPRHVPLQITHEVREGDVPMVIRLKSRSTVSR